LLTLPALSSEARHRSQLPSIMSFSSEAWRDIKIITSREQKSVTGAARIRVQTRDWSLASTHFVDSQYLFRYSFGCVLLLNLNLN